MKKEKFLCAALILVSVALLTACGPGKSHGISIYASTVINGCDNGGDVASVSGLHTTGPISGAYSQAFGYLVGGYVSTDQYGMASVGALDIPGGWNLERGGDQRFPDVCQTINPVYAEGGNTYPITCESNSFFQVDPDPLDLSMPPPEYFTLSASSGSMSCQYGMPQVRFYDDSGTLIATATATWAAADWSAIRVPVPWELTTVYSGRYAAIVYTVQPDGTFRAVNGGAFDVIGNDPPPPPPPPGDECIDPVTGMPLICNES